MSWDHQHAEDREEPTAGEYASQLAQRVRAVLAAEGHTECALLGQATYDAASGCAVCGCGVFGLLDGNQPDSPPWDVNERSDAAESAQLWEDADAADRAANAALAQRGGTPPVQAADPISSTLALIDPTEVYGPEDVERHILDTLWRLETGALFERETVIKAWETEQAFTAKFNARVLVNGGLRTDLCKAQSMVDCAEEQAAMAEAKMMKEAVKQTMHNLRAVLSGYQSTARSVGSAYQAGGSQGAPPNRTGRPW